MPLFPRDVLDELWDSIESVSEGLPTYFLNKDQIVCKKKKFNFEIWETFGQG